MGGRRDALWGAMLATAGVCGEAPCGEDNKGGGDGRGETEGREDGGDGKRAGSSCYLARLAGAVHGGGLGGTRRARAGSACEGKEAISVRLVDSLNGNENAFLDVRNRLF